MEGGGGAGGGRRSTVDRGEEGLDGWLRVWSMELYKFADYEAYV